MNYIQNLESLVCSKNNNSLASIKAETQILKAKYGFFQVYESNTVNRGLELKKIQYVDANTDHNSDQFPIEGISLNSVIESSEENRSREASIMFEAFFIK